MKWNVWKVKEGSVNSLGRVGYGIRVIIFLFWLILFVIDISGFCFYCWSDKGN